MITDRGFAGLTCDAFEMCEDVHFALISESACGVQLLAMSLRDYYLCGTGMFNYSAE